MRAKAAAISSRAMAAAIVHEVLHRGRSLDTVVDEALARMAPAQRADAALIQEMSYGSVRWAVQLGEIAHNLLARPLKRKDQDIEALLLVGLYQLIHLRMPRHAAVAETVAAVAQFQKPWAKGLVNAVLREFLRSEATLRTRIENDPVLIFSHPPELLQRLERAWPERWREICTQNNRRPPLTLRVNCRKTSRTDYLAELARQQISAQALEHVDCGITLERPVPVAMLPGFGQGMVSIQDGAAQLAAVLLGALGGDRVLDACAAPGGKATHILERTVDADLTVVDIDARRLDRLRDNFGRLGLSAKVVTGDASEPASWWDGELFDRILLDAPCSATGVIRRHPDIKLRRSDADMAKLCRLQARLLDGLWPLLRPGGKLLYVTCSVLPEENGDQINAFIMREKTALVAPLRVPCSEPDTAGHQILPGNCGMDGFFFAFLQKR
ncbi:MAG: 16S rRNA (cytosine(967)-C(5))-methyltransferase RsmB [Acidiferrobacterales bacterium]